MIRTLLFLTAVALTHGAQRSLTAPHPDCPAYGHHLLPHEYDCTKFYYCDRGERFINPTDCPENTEFSVALQVCTHIGTSGCNLSGTPPPNESTESIEDETPGSLELLDNGCPADSHVYKLLPDETSCRKFYYCVHGQKVEKSCGVGTVFNPDEQVCDHPYNVDRTCEDDEIEEDHNVSSDEDNNSVSKESDNISNEENNESSNESNSTNNSDENDNDNSSDEDNDDISNEENDSNESDNDSDQSNGVSSEENDSNESNNENVSSVEDDDNDSNESDVGSGNDEAENDPGSNESSDGSGSNENDSDSNENDDGSGSNENDDGSGSTENDDGSGSNEDANDDENNNDDDDDEELEVLPNGCPIEWSIDKHLPHEYYCSKSYQCVYGSIEEKACPVGTHFSYEVDVDVSVKKKKPFATLKICVTC